MASAAASVEETMNNNISYRRIYDEPCSTDGRRILVDRIWPRGVRKQDARLDEWMREIAPSTELRRWYGHDRERYAEFRRRYLAELRDPVRREAVERLRESALRDRMTLLTASHDLEHSQAAVLAQLLSRAENPGG
jgi:uncharacterized protein YeaO (DUF488 family)